MNEVYTAAVVGLGRIGSEYPSLTVPRSHAAAYMNNKRTKLVAGIDPDSDKQKAFIELWGNDIPVFESVATMRKELTPDIISLCVLPAQALDIIEQYSDMPPKCWYVEKPLLENIEHRNRLLQVVNDVPMAVNYHRCWDPAHVEFFNKVKESSPVRAIHTTYNHGLFNYASHMVALLIHHFGTVRDVKTLDVGEINVAKAEDPSSSFILYFDTGFEAVFRGMDEIDYDILETTIVCERGIYELKSAGCRRRRETPKTDAFYPGYRQLIEKKWPLPDSQVEGIAQALDNIVDFLDGRCESIASDIKLGMDVFDVLWQVTEQHLI